MKDVVELITPERAKEMLEKNKANRRIRWNWVRVISGMILRGEWELTHQGIAFDVNGDLLDGQHRLQAIAMGNKSVMMKVTYDCPLESKPNVDRGQNRNVADILGGSKALTQPAAFLARLVYGSNATIHRISQVHHGLGDIPELFDTIQAKHKKIVSSTPVRAAAILQIYRGHDRKYVMKVFSLIASLKTEDPEMPAIGHAFIRQMTGEVRRYYVTQDRARDLFVRALQVFDVSKKDTMILAVKNQALHLNEAKMDIIAILEEDTVEAEPKPRLKKVI